MTHHTSAPDSTLAEKLAAVEADIQAAAEGAGRVRADVTLVAISKTKTAADIQPFIDLGVRHFGENRVQEAAQKWPDVRRAAGNQTRDIELHLVGPLQSNKTKQAVALFDVIQTLDREKLVHSLAPYADEEGFPRLYIQVNIGAEAQKSGVLPQNLVEFHDLCQKTGLTIEGLMCIPPIDQAAGPYFALLGKLAAQIGVAGLSMGMSGDFAVGVGLGATHIRVGTALFGARDGT